MRPKPNVRKSQGAVTLSTKPVKASWVPHTLRQAKVCLALNRGKDTTLSIAAVSSLTARHTRRLLAEMWDDNILFYREWYGPHGRHAIWRVERRKHWHLLVMPAAHRLVRNARK